MLQTCYCACMYVHAITAPEYPALFPPIHSIKLYLPASDMNLLLLNTINNHTQTTFISLYINRRAEHVVLVISVAYC
jgi:hypothetical protein